MARLPQPGADVGTWGDVLNDYLAQVHNTDGTLKDNIVTSSALAPSAVTVTEIADGTITEAKLDTAAQAKLNSGGTAGVTSVNTRTGAVTLTKTDVGLANADNTSDANKPVSTATQTALTDALRLTDGIAMYSGSAYPTRASVTSDTTRRVRWVGPTAPAIGGAYAIDGLDVWEDTV